MGRLMWCTQLVCLQLVLLHSLSCANLCSNEQSSALLHFKQLFSFSNDSSRYYDYFGRIHSYPKMMDWKEDTDCCSWDGITCDRVTGHVIGLDLSGSGLQGNIPSNTSLFLLSHLQKLNLAFNDFNLSQIPSDFVRFPSLTHLNLSYSNFSGQVPFQITHLSKLISLDLSVYLSLDRALTLETLVMKGLVQNMSQLQELSLDSVNMSTVALGTLTNINLPSLTYLSLSYCGLQGSFPEIFINLTQLHTLDLIGNRLSGAIPSGVGGLRNLASINLVGNLLNGTIPSGLFSLPLLETISLGFNRLSGPIPSGLFSLPSLETISLAFNRLSGPIPSGLFSLPSLETISLEFNQLSGPIPSGLFSLPSLETISLGFNRLSGPIPSGLFSLPFNRLSGPIPSGLFCLPSLETIFLGGNQLSGPIPSSIFELVNLTELDLSSNHLSGTVELSMFAKLKKLQRLDLSGNSLSISTTIKVNSSFPRLYYLSLSSCNISEFPKILSTADNLRWLDLSDNKIHGHIPNWLFNISTLSSLYLSNNFLTGIERLPRSQSLNQQYGLRYLDLSLNQLSGPIPSSIFELLNLSHLDLSSNHLSGTVELSMFAKLKNLQRLVLSRSSLSISTTIKVNSSFPQLYDLRLSSCDINEFPEILSTVDHLHYLDLSDNKIHGHIPNWLFNISTLSSLNLSHNFLTGIEQLPRKDLQSLNQLSGPIPSSISELVNLDLSHNSLSMSTTITVNYSFPKLNILILSSCNINEFPEILSTVDNLQYLDLSDNKIHGHIPNWLFNISTLFFLNVSHNFLTGIEQLPWKGLQYLDLHSNLLQGLLPPPPPKLYFFSVSHNLLTGAIPSLFCNLSSLQYLDLSNNSLSGVIPQCLGNCTSIYVLDLKMNNFHGSIPQTFANGCQLTTLNLNSNHLAGSLPPSLANCGNLKVLDVGNNMINGTFPHWLATLSQLQVLILRSNRFYGALGDSITRLRFSMLRILDLSHNSFTGHLQTRFFRKFQAMMSGKNNSADMRYMGDNLYMDSITVTMKGFEIEMQRVLTIFTAMDLSSNKFQGRILDVVGKLNSLIVLNFSHNSLIGHIPLSMGNLTQLESLDLCSNKLDGKIPQELTSLTFLAVLNLSYNHLVGPIPQGNQFLTFGEDSYFGNLGLCGLPMSKTCSNDEPLESQPTMFHEEHDNLSWFDWKIIMMGYGSGIVIGLSIGYIVFSTGKPWWFVSMVERKVIKLTGSHRRRRN